MNEIPHIPVLFEETIASFKGVGEGVIVDCTLGYGGHSEGLLKAYPHVKVIGIDRDDEALAFSKKRLEAYGDRFEARKGSYSEVFPTLQEEKIVGVLADIGVSSLQLDKRERGFSFEGESLDMRMDQHQTFSAYDVVNRYSLEELERIILNYGEERAFKKVARMIVEARKQAPIESSQALASLIASQHKSPGIHPATRTFQAIRIEVNDELGELERLLNAAKEERQAGEIISIITFHSLEDRIAKQTFKEWTQKCICPPDAFRCTCGNNHELGRLVNKKPITASKEEIKHNSRSRSAKLRSFIFS